MDIVDTLNKELKVGDTVDICSQEYAIENDDNDYYGTSNTLIQWGDKDVIVTEVLRSNWYHIKGSLFFYKRSWLTRSK